MAKYMAKYRAIVEIILDDSDIEQLVEQAGKDIDPEDYLFGILQNEFGEFDILEFKREDD